MAAASTKAQRRIGELLVPSQIVRRIVRCAESRDAKFVQDTVNTKFVGGECGIRLFPNSGRGVLVQQNVNAEVAL